MTITTKYSHGDSIWIMRNNSAIKVNINQIGVDPFSTNVNYPVSDNIFYFVSDKINADFKVYEKCVFETKEALLQSL